LHESTSVRAVWQMKGIDEKELKRSYPHLHDEVTGNDNAPHEGGCHKLGAIKLDRGRGYDPSILDFLQRCSTDAEAMEIICFMEKRGEISRAYAASLMRRLSEGGVRSFGAKRLPGHYERTLR